MSGRDVRVNGVEIEIAGDRWVLAPCPLVKLSTVTPLMGGGSLGDASYTNALVDGVYYGLLRNYPDMKREVVADNLDLSNYHAILRAFLEVNLMTKKEEGGTAEAGETPAS